MSSAARLLLIVIIIFLQKVDLEVTSKTGESTVRPGEDVEILVKTSGEAIVGLKGVDKRLSFMADQNDITMSEV